MSVAWIICLAFQSPRHLVNGSHMQTATSLLLMKERHTPHAHVQIMMTVMFPGAVPMNRTQDLDFGDGRSVQSRSV